MKNRKQIWIDRYLNSFFDTFKSMGRDKIRNTFVAMGFQAGDFAKLSLTDHIYLTYEYSKNTLSIVSLKTKQRGFATLKWGDNFDLFTGIAIAWARFRGRKIPDFILSNQTSVQKPNNYHEFKALVGKPILFDYSCNGIVTTFSMLNFQFVGMDIAHKYLPVSCLTLFICGYNYRNDPK